MNSYLETGLSLILIFFIFSVIAYVIQELIAVNLQYRSKVLWKSLAQLFDNTPIPTKGRDFLLKKLPLASRSNTKVFFDHPEIKSLQKNLDKLPSYIPAANFALAVMDSIAGKATTKIPGDLLKNINQGLTFVNSQGNIYKIVQNLLDTSTTVKELQEKLENWYTLYMDRVTGWYKSDTLLTLRLIALGVTLFFNINVINLSKEIFNDSQLRGTLVGIAEHLADHPETVNEFYIKNFDTEAAAIDSSFKSALVDSTKTEIEKAAVRKQISDAKRAAADLYTQKRIAAMDSLSRKLTATNIPLGWKESFVDTLKGKDKVLDFFDVVFLFLGWLISAGCISMGAPFWFDLLVKVVNIRRAGIKPTSDDTKRQ